MNKNDEDIDQIIKHINRKTFEYCHINFFIGAGVNAELIGLFDTFNKTIDRIKKSRNKKFSEMIKNEKTSLKNMGIKNPLSLEKGRNVDLETYFSLLEGCGDEAEKEEIMTCFYDELKEKNKKALDNIENDNNIKELTLFINITNMLLNERETNTSSMKIINYFTLNYDSIIDYLMNNSSEEWNIFSPKNIYKKNKIIDQFSFDQTGKDSKIRWNIFKLHGDINDKDKNKIIFPSIYKHFTANYSEFYELIFSMRRKLSIQNSVLIILGYSLNDDHINTILNEVHKNGTIIIFFAFDEKDSINFEKKFSNVEKKFIINTYKNSSISFYNSIIKKILGNKWLDENNE